MNWNRHELARYGLTIDEAQAVLQSAIGGECHHYGQGRERYPVNVRYMRDFRSDIDAIGRVLVPARVGEATQLSQLATIQTVGGPR